jgi:phosphotransacetylase
MSADMLTAARAEALFTSDLSASCRPTASQVAEAIRHAVRVHRGTRGCAAEVAAAFGDHPEVAVPRMRWARGVVAEVYRHRP